MRGAPDGMDQRPDQDADQRGHWRGHRHPGSRTALLIGAGVVALVAAATASAWPSGSMTAAQPAGVRGTDLGWVRAFAVSQIGAFVLYAAALLLIRRHAPGIRAAVVIAVVIQLLPLCAPLMLSTDAWAYWSAGRIAVIDGGNPYRDPPSAYPADPSYRYTAPVWRPVTTVYGPLFTLASEGVALVADGDARSAAWLFRATAAAAMVALVVLLSRVATRAAFAVAFVGWNPILAVQAAGSGHNDALMTLFLVGGIALAMRARRRPAGWAWAVAVFIKWTAAVVLPLQLIEDRARRRTSALPGLVLGLLVLAAASTLVFGTWWPSALMAIVDSSASAQVASPALGFLLRSRLPGVPVTLVAGAIVTVTYVFLLRQAWHGRARRGLAAGIFAALGPVLWPWYVIMPAALSALDDDRVALLLALGLCAWAGLYYYGDGGYAGRVLDLHW